MSEDSSPIPKAQREVVSKYPRLENGHPVGSLDPEPIKLRDKEIDAIWRAVVQYFKMYLDDIVIVFDVASLKFNRSATPMMLNSVREAILKRLAYDGIKAARISMPQNLQHYSLELVTPGHQHTLNVLHKEIFSLVEVKRAPDFSSHKKPGSV